MRFRDNRSWVIWITSPVLIGISIYWIRQCCEKVALAPDTRYFQALLLLLISLFDHAVITILIFSLTRLEKLYEMNENGIVGLVEYVHKVVMPVPVPWGELNHCGVYRHWRGGTDRYVYISNYAYDGKGRPLCVNDARKKKALFLVPLTKRGWEAIERYVPDDLFDQLAKDPGLKNIEKKKLDEIIKRRKGRNAFSIP